MLYEEALNYRINNLNTKFTYNEDGKVIKTTSNNTIKATEVITLMLQYLNISKLHKLMGKEVSDSFHHVICLDGI